MDRRIWRKFFAFSLLMCTACGITPKHKPVQLDSASVFIGIADADERRTVMPEQPMYSDYSYELYGAYGSSEQRKLGEWSRYSDMVNDFISVKEGNWIFELQALRNGKTILKGVESFRIKNGENHISFVLRELSSGKGSVDFSLFMSPGDFRRVQVAVLDESGNSIPGFSRRELEMAYDSAHCMNVANAKADGLDKGYYILRFYLYEKISDMTFKSVYNVFVRVEPNFVSKGEDVLDGSDCNAEIGMTGIEIDAYPTKTIYYDGEKLSLGGLVVRAVYADEARRTLTDYTTSIADGGKLSVSDNKVCITYGEHSCFFDITVLPNSVDGMTVSIVESGDACDLVDFSSASNIFSAKTGFGSYVWWLDGTKVVNGTRFFRVADYVSQFGNHLLMLQVEDGSGKKYSAELDFVVYSSELAFLGVIIKDLKEADDLLSYDAGTFCIGEKYIPAGWWIDGTRVFVSSRTVAVSELDVSAGNHFLTVVAKDSDGHYFSASASFAITEATGGNGERVTKANLINVTIFHQSDIPGMLVYDSGLARFEAARGMESYVWWIDDRNAQAGKSRFFDLKTHGLESGNHCLLLSAEDKDGNVHSAVAEFFIMGDVIPDDCGTKTICVSIDGYRDAEDMVLFDQGKMAYVANGDFSKCEWWVDDRKVSDAATLGVRSLDVSAGHHCLMLVATDRNGRIYSRSFEMLVY